MPLDRVVKRDGTIVPFDRKRIENAIYAAARAVGNGEGRQWAETLSWATVGILEERLTDNGHIPHVEEIQDIVEEVLIKSGNPRVSKAYILYRQQRAAARDARRMMLDGVKLVEDYLQRTDWRVNENSNMNYSLQGLNFYIASSIAAHYWLHKVYPPEVQAAHIEGSFHIHDLGMLSTYCCGWDLQDLLRLGFGGVSAKLESKPPRHLRTALGQLVNFFYTLQGESAGAQAVSNFDTLLAPFVRYDNLDYRGVKQAIQEFVFNINVPTRVGFQSLVGEELVVVRHNDRVKVVEIGQLVDDQFSRNKHRVQSQGNGSYAVINADDVQALAFDGNGQVIWAPVKAFVRHRVPKGADFVRVRTSRGTASVSQAHSMFAFGALDGRFDPRPMTACGVDVVHSNAIITPTNHFVAVRNAPNRGSRDVIDLVELIDTVPQVAERTRVRVPDPVEAVERLRQRVKETFGGFTPFYLEYGIKDKSCWSQWARNASLPYLVWRALGEDEADGKFALRNSKLWYRRYLAGEQLGEFIRLLAWYITEGHNDITNGLYVSQARGEDQEEIAQVMSALGALGRVEEMQGWSSKSNPTSSVLRMAGKGLLATLIGYSGGTYSTNKVIPWFVYELTSQLQEILIATLIRGDGSEYAKHFDYTTTSKKLSLGLSLLLAMNGYKFSVYETTYERETWNDQYILRIYKDKEAVERYAVGDLLARVCTRRETFVYDREYEYDLSVNTELENFCGGSGLLCFHNTPFTNLTFDLTPSPVLRDQPVLAGGELQSEMYGEFQPEMDMINRAFAEVLLEGDAKGRVFTFPIPTYAISKGFEWENPMLEPIWCMTAKYGTPYFSNFINSDMRPEDTRSMCCRLRLDNRELRKRGGGLFGANPLTGSIGVVTINMPRLGYLSRDEGTFFEQLSRLMDVARTSLGIKRKILEQLTEQGLYPYSRYYLRSIHESQGAYWANHFSTIGLSGMNEACCNLLGVSIADPAGKAFAIRVLSFMRERLAVYQEESGDLFNLEATPAESASYRLAKADKERYPGIRTAGTPDVPYYTNSTHLPVGYTDDIFEALEHQDDLQVLYTGGTVLHGFLGEQIDDWRQARALVRRIAENFRLPYYTLTPTFSICPVHGYLPGKHEYCPYDHSEEDLARYGVEVDSD
jgi:anaerobic ribonucleoside-triphosphate reductase